eukprot:461903_1
MRSLQGRLHAIKHIIKHDSESDDDLEQEHWNPKFVVQEKEINHELEEQKQSLISKKTIEKEKNKYWNCKDEYLKGNKEERQDEYLKLVKQKGDEYNLKQEEIEYENKKQYDLDTKVIKQGGFFQIQVHIIRGSDFVEGKDFNNACDPVVVVEILNKKRTTKVLKKQLNPYWDQILYFEFDLQPNELSKGKCLIKVYDFDMISFNDLIGIFQFDLAWI